MQKSSRLKNDLKLKNTNRSRLMEKSRTIFHFSRSKYSKSYLTLIYVSITTLQEF
ncbi:hypothetical protein LEP1GSC120_0172 [Leptospira santarosai str. 200702252]|nr:hypothetical protein LEP1GSC130_3417 [Leptospira santarosai str. 200403458]EMO97027.1 hypothetical protein LEP1GSC120_0172 [Leptospira santarosai str. 200702252]